MPWTANNNPAGEIRAPAMQSALKQKQQNEEKQRQLRTWSLPLRMIMLEEFKDLDPYGMRYCALLHPDDFPPPPEGSTQNELMAKDVEFVHPRLHAQFVIPVRSHTAIPRGCIALTQPQMINLEVCVGQIEQWSLFNERVPMINAMSIEIRPLITTQQQIHENGERQMIITDAKEFAVAFGKYTWQRILTENERLVMRYTDGLDYFVRVIEIDAEDESETEFTMPDSFRGLVDEETQVFVTIDGVESEDSTFKLQNASELKASSLTSLRTDTVTVLTNDEEEFPVKKKLLFPCIKLSSAVLAGKGVHKDSSSTITVNVDCCTFDRVLLYLEHEARNDGTEFQFDPSYAEELLTAAITLECIGLQDICKKRLGEFDTRVRKEAIRWEEVVRRNNAGEVWLVMLGMVFDVTRWLPEHPGGSVIIPREAVNVDCTVMFEIYHASRQSFRYLKQFYIGELLENDLSLVPTATEKPSTAFVEELRQGIFKFPVMIAEIDIAGSSLQCQDMFAVCISARCRDVQLNGILQRIVAAKD